ncbi:cytochrome P450 family protein [Rhizoctonia solani AG-3 Rhs1AP]|uniref:Cytochrome P450 family protein n=1 Tax=Rhizoctonia solani AG-3 Rhs1AP TaxID=1086054 RepID=A0A0A1UK52_9AGAM|nr:cytochrome P450 family protein [Rhizoctonia solani AG-3 Rhs1AP]
MSQYLHTWEILLLCAGFSFILWRRLVRSQGLPLPPGPPPHFLLGNLRDFPRDREWLGYAKIGQDYQSDIISLSALGKTVIVLNSHRAVTDLLDSRAKYADRPQIPMINLMGLGNIVTFSQYGPRWRALRKAIHLDMQESVMPKYWSSQETEARRLVARLLAHGDKTLLRDVQHWAAAFLLSGTFGYHLPADTSNDPLLPYMEELLDMVTSGAQTSRFLVNLFPALKYWPEWMPGGSFQAIVRRARELRKLAGDDPFDRVKTEMANGVAHSSYVSRMLSEFEQDSGKGGAAGLENQVDYEELIRANAVTLFGVTTLISFIVAMQMYPKVQTKAREEVLSTLDPMTGQPVPAEIVQLPYLRNLLREVMRWLPALPLGIPHATKEEDEYRGYYIPAQSVIVPNLWALSRERSIYPDPETFNPDRFNDTSLPHDTPFGFGRRRCPGMHLANSNLLIVLAYLLANFEITKATMKTAASLSLA